MQWEVRGMADASPRVSDTLPRRGRVNEVCREWVVHEDEALAYQLQKQEVEQHYGGNKERNARVREDFPKAKEEQEKEIIEAAEKYRQMVRKQEQLDSMYAHHVAERLDSEEQDRQRRTQQLDIETARKIQAYEVARNSHQPTNGHQCRRVECKSPVRVLPMNAPDVNRVGLPLPQNSHIEHVDRHVPNLPLTQSLRKLRLNDDSASSLPQSSVSLSFPPPPHDADASPSSSSSLSSPSPLTSSSYDRSNISRTRTPTPATFLSDDLNGIIRDVDLQEEADRRLQEEKDAELARMLQQQEEEILNEEVDRDRMMAIEAQDKELAKLLYEKEKAKVRRAKERARQRALLKKQQVQQQQQQQNELVYGDGVEPAAENSASSVSAVQSRVESNAEGITSEYSGNELRMCDGGEHRPPEVEVGRYESNHRSVLCDGGESGPSEAELGRYEASHSNSFHMSSLTCGRNLAPPLMNVAMHIDPTYLSQQSSSMPNSLIFQEGETTAPPYMPIQGQRRNTPVADKKPKKSKSKDGCKQQ